MNPEEREWMAQEAATSFDRAGLMESDLDPLTASYVSVARAMREPIEMRLPADFARRVSALAAARPVSVEVESGLERRLLLTLGIVLGLAAVVVAIVYGSSWLRASLGLFSQLGEASQSLALTLLGCLAVSAISQQLRRWLQESRRDYA